MKAATLPSERELLGELLLGWTNVNVAVATRAVEKVMPESAEDDIELERRLRGSL